MTSHDHPRSAADNTNENNNDNKNNNDNNDAPTMKWSKQDLFGGAMTCDIPQEWRDVSHVRQVPDNQEVYQEVNTNRVVVVEVLEYQSHLQASKEAASFFFTNLAEDNGIPQPTEEDEHVRLDTLVERSSSLSSSTLRDPCFTTIATQNIHRTTNVHPAVGGALGYQNVAKEHTQGEPLSSSWIQVELCVLRLAKQETDLLLILSTPVERPPDVIPSTTGKDEQQLFSDTFSRIVSTFTIQDWSLFG